MRGSIPLNMGGEINMESILREHGFISTPEDPFVLEASFTSEESAYLADALGITDEYETIVIKVDTVDNSVSVYVDGSLDMIDMEELIPALEGE